MNDLRELCMRMVELQDTKESLEKQLADVNKQFDHLRMVTIPANMQNLGIKNTTFSGIGRVQLADDLYASTKPDKKEQAMEWLRDCGYSSMIVETYNASSLKALFRRQIKEGIEIPDDIFSVTPFTRASIVKV